MKLDAPFIRFEGPLSGILEARRGMQAFLDEACDNQAVTRRELQDVIALTKYADAVPLMSKRKREAKLDRFKEALRPLTHPVALVTVSLPVKHGEKTIDHYRGVTVSSFTSVSMSKADPLVSFNLRLPSRTWDAMKSNKAIGINLLDASPEGAAIAHAFTQPHDDPSEAFREIRRLGYELVPFLNWAHCVRKRAFKRGSPSGVFCTLAAQVVEDKCVDVGDHVIVVAAVKFARWVKSAKEKAADGELFGLAYNNKEYRTAGLAIKPASIPDQDELRDETAPREIDVSEDVEDEHAAGELETNDSPGNSEINETPINHIVDSDFQSREVEEGDPYIEDQTSMPVAETAITGADESSGNSSVQTLTSVDEEQSARSLEAMDANLADRLDSSEPFDQASSESTPNKPRSTPLQNSETRPSGTQPTSNSLPGFLKQSFRSYHTPARAPTAQAAQAQIPMTDKEDQRDAQISDQSTLTTTVDDFLGSHDNELYSGTSTKAETSGIDQVDSTTMNDGNAPQSGVADTALLSTTISDFLNSHDEDPYVPRRMRALMKAEKQVYLASKRLERNLETGTLTSKEAYQLQRSVILNERWIAKRLAFNSAYDLRLMLDKGKVDVRRAQWLESSIEKGQAVILAELQQIREMVQEGKMKEERYEIVKGNLETDHQTLATEAMRLRQMVEEEGYEGGALAPEKKGFDGFSGNV
jgi:flavin reductase (DIM6/NTAB) family NADH-FMN oxidoreductase RutF